MRILNLFNWKLNDVEKHLYKIQEQGFNYVQISTIQGLQNEESWEWWNSYLTNNYYIGNHFGNKNDLINLCKNAKLYGIKIIVEIVPINILENDVNRIGKINYKLLGLGEKYSFLEEERYKIYHLICELIDCGVEGICFNCSQIKLPSEGNDFFQDISLFFHKYNIECYTYCVNVEQHRKEEYIKYVKIATDYQNYDNLCGIKYIECPYSYFDYNFGITSVLSSKQITNKYKDLCEKYNETIYYARPNDDEWKSPIIKEANKEIKKVFINTRKII